MNFNKGFSNSNIMLIRMFITSSIGIMLGWLYMSIVIGRNKEYNFYIWKMVLAVLGISVIMELFDLYVFNKPDSKYPLIRFFNNYKVKGFIIIFLFISFTLFLNLGLFWSISYIFLILLWLVPIKILFPFVLKERKHKYLKLFVIQFIFFMIISILGTSFSEYIITTTVNLCPFIIYPMEFFNYDNYFVWILIILIWCCIIYSFLLTIIFNFIEIIYKKWFIKT